MRRQATESTRHGPGGLLVTMAITLSVVLGGCETAVPTATSGGSPGPSGSHASALPSPSSTSAAPSTDPSPGPSPSVPLPTASAGPSQSAPVSPTATPTVRPTAAPTPRPTPRPTATPRATATPTPPPAASKLLTHGSRTSRNVALTLDMGGRVGDAVPIMSWLVAHDVHASIFMTGAMADNPSTDAGRKVLAIIEAHPDLFTLGNHSYTHRDFRTLTAAGIRTELSRTETALAARCSQNPRPFFRPPNGGYDAGVLAAVGAAGYRDTVTWDIDTIDWRPIVNDPPGPTADQIVSKVLTRAQGGSIVLMHLGGYETLDALPRIVAGLTADGFALVTLDEMF